MITNLNLVNKSSDFQPMESLLKSFISFCCSLTQGFDEFMNLVMDEAQEVYQKQDNRRQIG